MTLTIWPWSPSVVPGKVLPEKGRNGSAWPPPGLPARGPGGVCRKEGRPGFIFVRGLLPWDCSHLLVCLLGSGVSSRTMGQGEGVTQLGWPRCEQVWGLAGGVRSVEARMETAAASAHPLFLLSLGGRSCSGPNSSPEPTCSTSTCRLDQRGTEPLHPAPEGHTATDRQQGLGSRALGLQVPGPPPWTQGKSFPSLSLFVHQ